MGFETIDYAVTDRVAEITMRRAPVNAINHQLTEEINAAYRMASDDDGVRAVILTSAFDTVFSAGMDLAMIHCGNRLFLHSFLEKFYFQLHDHHTQLGMPPIG